jgi:hypothetical protein
VESCLGLAKMGSGFVQLVPTLTSHCKHSSVSSNTVIHAAAKDPDRVAYWVVITVPRPKIVIDQKVPLCESILSDQGEAWEASMFRV